jgi:hypothetical protein
MDMAPIPSITASTVAWAARHIPLVCALLIFTVLSLTAALLFPMLTRENQSRAAWETYLKTPYSVQALKNHLRKVDNDSRPIIGSRVISGVYRACHNDRPMLYIVEFSPGIVSGYPRTFFGMLMAFDAEERHVKTWVGESIEKGVVASDSITVASEIRQGEIIDLPDINGDSFSEIPAYRWGITRQGIDRTAIIYTIRTAGFHCAFALECYENVFGSSLTGDYYLKKSDKEAQTLLLEFQPYKVKEITRREPKKEKIRFVDKILLLCRTRVVKPPTMEIVLSRDSCIATTKVAEFTWSDSLQTFAVSFDTMKGSYKVVDAEGREIISRTMEVPPRPGFFRSLKYRIFSAG